MAGTTAVPIHKINRAWLVWLGAGVAAAALGGIALAYEGTQGAVGVQCSTSDFKSGPAAVHTASGLMIQTLKAGAGPSPTDADIALIGYSGTLRNGTVFDSQPRVPMPLKGVIPGFAEAMKLMQVGGHYRFCIPSNLAYGPKAAGPIPANSPLIFDVQLQDFRSEAEVRAMQQQMQQMQAQGRLPQGAQPGAQGAPTP